MARYFIEVAYKGTAYGGFQIQQNSNTIQAEVEKALSTYFRESFAFTGSSRTDAGVHAAQNYFHFDTERSISPEEGQKAVYHLNAILPGDIVTKTIREVAENAHSRFDAVSRSYEYSIYSSKDPFLDDRAYYYPYTLDVELMNKVAALCLKHTNYLSFSKKNTQVFTHECSVSKSEWVQHGNLLKYHVTGNRFLRGMVRGLAGTMLLAGRGKYTPEDFQTILNSGDSSPADFSAPAKGLILAAVKYPAGIFNK